MTGKYNRQGKRKNHSGFVSGIWILATATEGGTETVKEIVTIVTKIETGIVDAIVTEIGIETGTGTETRIGTGIEIGIGEETVTEIVIGEGVPERIEIVKDESGVVAGGCGTCSNVVMSLRTFVLCTKN